MIKTHFEQLTSVLCLGAHSDDIEIGCGGTVLKLTEQFPACQFHWVVFGAGGVRAEEAEASASRYLSQAGSKLVLIKDYRDGFFPYVGADIKDFFEDLKGRVEPDLIFSHHGRDLHQDHRLISELTWNTFRNHVILEYEIPKYDGDLGSPNFFVHLEESHRARKMGYLLESFKSQSSKPWFTEDTFNGLMRLRGMESNAPSKYAEGFYSRKMRW